MGILSALKRRQQEKKESAEFKAKVEEGIKERRREGYRKQRIEQAEQEGREMAKEELKPKESGLQRMGRIASNLSQSMEKADVMGTKDLKLDADAFSLGSAMFGESAQKKKDRGVGIA